MQDPNELTPPVEGAQPTPGGDEAAVDAKPKRSRRAKAAAEPTAEADALVADAADPADPVAPQALSAAPARKTPRRRAKAVDSTESLAAVDAQGELLDQVTPAAEAAAGEDAAADSVTVKPARAPRRKAAVKLDPDGGAAPPPSAEALQPAASAADAEAPSAVVREAAANGFLMLAPEDGLRPDDASPDPLSPAGGEQEQQDGSTAAAERRRDRGDRRDRRERPPRAEREPDMRASREDGEEAPEGEGADARPSRRAALAAEQASAVFTELLSGDFDKVHEEEPETGDEEAVQAKRVLRPEPDAPKLQKVLAQSGVGSRRDIEQMIEDGRISVNGEVAHIGQRVSFGDKIAVGGKPIRVRISPPPARILAYHKPVGEVVTHEDPQNRPTVFRRLPRLQHGKWLSVGRLDLNTEGLLLFTNSGDLANQLMHPRFGVEREYAVRVLGTLSAESKARLLEGVEIEGQAAGFKSIEEGGGEGVNRWYRVVITEGRNREVRKLFDAVGLTVSRLIRVRYGSIVLPLGLKRGVWVELGESDVRAVKALAGADRQDGQQQQGRRGDRDDRQQGRGAQRGGQPGQGQGQQGQGKFGKDRDRFNNQGGKGPRGQGHGGQGGRGPGADRPQDRPAFKQRDERPADRRPEAGGDEDWDDIGPIPNPLEQTFDRRFAKGSKRISSGFGRPDHEGHQGGGAPRKGQPKQPDPLQTAVGYIGADAFFGRSGGGNRGGGGGNRGGGGGGGGRHRR